MRTVATLHLSSVFWSGASRVGGGGEAPLASAAVGRTGVVTVGSSGGRGASEPRGGVCTPGVGGEAPAGSLFFAVGGVVGCTSLRSAAASDGGVSVVTGADGPG